jgi:hypothetical protein
MPLRLARMPIDLAQSWFGLHEVVKKSFENNYLRIIEFF